MFRADSQFVCRTLGPVVCVEIRWRVADWYLPERVSSGRGIELRDLADSAPTLLCQ